MMRHKASALGLGAAALAASLAAAPKAEAYVRYRTSLDQPYSWRKTSVSILGFPHGLPNMTVDEISTAMHAAVGAWSKEDPQNACTYLGLQVTIQPIDAIPPDAIHDDKNVIAMRDGVWTSICSTTKDGKQDCHTSGELALTTVWSKGCGEIVEADVEVNAQQGVSILDFSWADLDDTTDTTHRLHDLQNALTHEMGHFIGLDHTCVLNGAYALDKNGVPIIPKDNLGNDVLDCTNPAVTDAIRATTMYPSADPGDVDKRTLSDDDRLGLCQIYPVGTTPDSCGQAGSGCAVAPAELADPTEARRRAPFGLLAGIAGGLGAVLIARRRRG